jgi:tRNA wybutosine-synthesizing protein 2
MRDESSVLGTEDSTLGISDLPKRFTIYPPLLLLPNNFTTHSPRWKCFYDTLTEADRDPLFRDIVEGGFAGMGISRIAINAPIAADEIVGPSQVTGVEHESMVMTENVLRSPSGLVPLFGDWGASKTVCKDGMIPAKDDFEQAFWVSTSQHKGITQCWAPIYTMFSRGNISEKARILGLDAGTGQSKSSFQGLTETELGERTEDVDVVDFYVGIGYFAFSYLKRGIRTVWGWDINPWSIEGLRRGCETNGWRCLVLQVDCEGNMLGMSLPQLAETLVKGTGESKDQEVRCVAFLGDNKWSAKVMKNIHDELKALSPFGRGLNIRHANMGLLPSSQGSWENAIALVRGTDAQHKESWLHVHENVDIHQIDAMKAKIVRQIEVLASEREKESGVSCIHVHQVKTYAPGVMHCVFDIQMKPNG